MADVRLIDRRAAHPGPGIHVLIVGVSQYDHLPPRGTRDPSKWNLAQLESSAVSALTVWRTLEELDHQNLLDARIKTARVLLSPSPAEIAREAAFATSPWVLPTRQAFQEAAAGWRNDASAHEADTTFFFYSGHGVMRSPESAILTFTDIFNAVDAPASSCAASRDIFNGMAPSPQLPNVSRTQFYFFDCCRSAVEELVWDPNAAARQVFPGTLNGVDNRVAPMYFASVPGDITLADPSGLTVFGSAVDYSLRKGAVSGLEIAPGRVIWPVTTLSMDRVLRVHLDKYSQKLDVGGRYVDSTLIRLPNPPTVTVRLALMPAGRMERQAQVDIQDDQRTSRCRMNPWDRTIEPNLASGHYRLHVQHADMQQPYESTLVQFSPGYPFPWTMDFSGYLTP